MGIKDIGTFNKVLLGKWIDRILCNPECLWAKVLKSKYDNLEYNNLGDNNRKVLGWWRYVCELYYGVEGNGLASEFEKIVRNGEKMCFWESV